MKQNIIVAHGSRKRGRNAAIERSIHDLLDDSGKRYKIAFLDNLEEVMERAIEAGCTQLTLVPLLFFSASHYLEDIPETVACVKRRHDIPVDVADVIGRHPLMAQLIEKRLRDDPPPEGAAVVLLAHGNPEFTEADRELSNLAEHIGSSHDIYPAMLHGALEIGALLPGISSKFEQIHVMPISIDEGFLVSRMRAAFSEHIQEERYQFMAAVGFDPLIGAVLIDHMK